MTLIDERRLPIYIRIVIFNFCLPFTAGINR